MHILDDDFGFAILGDDQGFPLFGKLTSTANPQLAKALDTVKVTVTADPAKCGSLFDPVGIRTFTDFDANGVEGVFAGADVVRLVDVLSEIERRTAA